MTQVLLRAALTTDLAAIVTLELESNPHPWSEALVADALVSRQCWLLQCEQSGSVVAWMAASLVFDQTELEMIVISHAWRRKGLGKQLLEHWLAWAEKHNCYEALLEVRASNDDAINLYRTLGFAEVGQRKNYYPLADGSKEHAVLMTRHFNEER